MNSYAHALGVDRFTVDLLDALPDATAVLDRWGTIIAVNRVWRMFALDNGGAAETTGVGVSYLEVCAPSPVSAETNSSCVRRG